MTLFELLVYLAIGGFAFFMFGLLLPLALADSVEPQIEAHPWRYWFWWPLCWLFELLILAVIAGIVYGVYLTTQVRL